MDFNLDENLWNQLTELLSSFGISFFIALCILIIGRQAIKIIIIAQCMVSNICSI